MQEKAKILLFFVFLALALSLAEPVLALNTPPAAPTELLLNSTIYVGESLTAIASGSTDIDLDNITYYYRFYGINDSILLQDYSSSDFYAITSSEAHDIILVSSKAFDGTEYSDERNASIEVSNTAPVLGEPLINETAPHLLNTINCGAGSYSDIDSDSEATGNREWLWYVNGTETAVTTQNIVISGDIGVGAEIVCSERTSDGFEYSNYANSSNIATVAEAEGTSGWWNSSFDEKIIIDCSNMAEGTPILINGSAGFNLGSGTQTVWTNCQKNTGLSIYYNSSDTTRWAIANGTSAVNWNTKIGNNSGFNSFEVFNIPALQSAWLFDEASGIIASDERNRNNFTAYNSPPIVAGEKSGNSRTTTGTNRANVKYLKTASGLGYFGEKFSVSFWSRRLDERDSGVILVRRDGGDQQGIFSIDYAYTSDANRLMISELFSSEYNSATSSPIVKDNNWHFITVTYDNGIPKIYFDGNDAGIASNALSNLPADSTPILTGKSSMLKQIILRTYFRQTQPLFTWAGASLLTSSGTAGAT
jgi:hypothetical protein